VLADRAKSEDLSRMGGIAMRAPVLAALFLVVALANLAMPGSANFAGEFYILNGVFDSKIAFAFIAAIGIALAAFYSLRFYERAMHNRLPEGVESREIGARDGLVLAPLVAIIVALALWPGLILERGEAAVTAQVQAVALADCFDGAYVNVSEGAAPITDQVSIPCAGKYGLDEDKLIASVFEQ
jgi:NADH-quinone oxidoreductase subunit M